MDSDAVGDAIVTELDDLSADPTKQEFWRAVARGVGTVPGIGAWSLAEPPASPHALDDEFDGAVNGSWSWWNTHSADDIDPYAAFSTGGLRTDLVSRRSWLRLQPPNDGSWYGRHVALTLPTNCAIWARLQYAWRRSGVVSDDGNIWIGFYASVAGVPDPDNCMIAFPCEADAGSSGYQMTRYKLGVASALSGGFYENAQAVLVQKIGNNYTGWVLSECGHSCIGTLVWDGSAVLDRLALGCMNNSSAAPGNIVLGADYVRVYAGILPLP